ncbi:MAG: ShlB/FhaC/HecB family hemolysin secretion/activation protein [Symploca sp. SIO2G7]|nr:ShlB/FhaC/HecB family hemolysin secretion/activation protein [Symploca sp. SIO2G7]
MYLSHSLSAKLWLMEITLTLAILTSGLTTSPSQAETVASLPASEATLTSSEQAVPFFLECADYCSHLAQTIPNNSPKPSVRDNLQPRDIFREEPSLPDNFEELPPSLPDNPLLDQPDTPIEPGQSIPGSLVVERFEFRGNTVFSSERLAEEVPLCISEALPEEVRLCPPAEERKNSEISYLETSLLDIANQSISFNQLNQIVNEVAKFYHQQGYEKTNVTIDIPQNLQKPPVLVIEVTEIHLEIIEVTETEAEEDESPSLKQQSMRNYVKSRLRITEPLNIDELKKSLRLLYLDPLIAGISAKLSNGSELGKKKLQVWYIPADSFNLTLATGNNSPPSVGSFQRQVVFREANLLGLGDGLTIGYSNTDGSNGFNISYTIPMNFRNGTLGISYENTENNIIEPPFNDLDKDGSGPDITSSSRSYGIELRQPLLHDIVDQTVHEFAIGVNGSWRESNSSVLGVPFPLSPGAEDNGFTRIVALGFYQEYKLQNARNLLFLRSQFNWGLNAFNSTINEQIPGVEAIPDSEFFSWQGQALYLRFLDSEDTYKRLSLRLNTQIADRTLLPIKQFSLGGSGSARGYRRSTLVTDNGVSASAELQWPILRVLRNSGVIQLIPFIDVGAGWNSSGKPDPDPNFLAAVGVGVQWQQGNSLTARLDWGVPLVSVDSRDRTWQENGLHFSVRWDF